MHEAMGLTQHHKKKVLTAGGPWRVRDKNVTASRGNLKLGIRKSPGSVAALISSRKRSHCLQTLITIYGTVVNGNIGLLWKTKTSASLP